MTDIYMGEGIHVTKNFTSIYPLRDLMSSGAIVSFFCIFLFINGCASIESAPDPQNPTPISQLQSLYQSCKAYWAENGEDKVCNVSIASKPEYGFVKSEGVDIQGEGHRKSFIGIAKDKNHDYIYHMDTEGNIM